MRLKAEHFTSFKLYEQNKNVLLMCRETA